MNAITGVLFLTMQPHLYLGSGVWWFKVGFIALAGLNAMFFETRLSQQALALAPGRRHAAGDEGHRRSFTVQLVRGAVLWPHAAVSGHGY